MICTYIFTSLARLYLDIFNDRPNITWLKDGVELNSFSEHEHVNYCKSKSKFHVPTKFQVSSKKSSSGPINFKIKEHSKENSKTIQRSFKYHSMYSSEGSITREPAFATWGLIPQGAKLDMRTNVITSIEN